MGSLRHAMLSAAGAPTVESDVVNDTRLAIGTMTHHWLENNFRSAPVMNEVNLKGFLPEGWNGTADALFWNAERRAFVLVDYKTCKPTAIPYIHKSGVKDTHLWQVSAYWWACVAMGLPMVKGFGVLYLPIEQLRAKDGFVAPTFQEATPLPKEQIEPVMNERWAATKAYLASIGAQDGVSRNLSSYVTDALAPVQDRVVKLYLNKQVKRPVLDVKLQPHWSTEFCPYPDELCNCREQKANKIGAWDRDDTGKLVYVPRKDMEQPADIPRPDKKLIDALVTAQKEAEDAAS